MINREIIYDRSMTGSYMKIPAGLNAGLDEKLMLKRKLSGTLPVEKTYVDGAGQYWYNISGKQSLDTYCRVKEIGIAFVERLIISICSELDILEWNLLHTSCLMLDPELIFITSSNQEFIFTLYPGNNIGIEMEFQQLLEYLLKKIDHQDVLGVRKLYAMYERTLVDGYSILDIQQEIIEEKKKDAGGPAAGAESFRETEENFRSRTPGKPVDKVREPSAPASRRSGDVDRSVSKNEGGQEDAAKKRGIICLISDFLKETIGITIPEGFFPKRKQSTKQRENKGVKKRVQTADHADLIYPEEQIVEPCEEIHPTICLSNFHGAPRGLLMYQGAEQMADIRLEAKVSRIGHCSEAEVQIDRDTISQMHARIDRDGENFYIEDLNSTNGTYVNDEPLVYKERRQLKVNDIVRFADIRYRFC